MAGSNVFQAWEKDRTVGEGKGRGKDAKLLRVLMDAAFLAAGVRVCLCNDGNGKSPEVRLSRTEGGESVHRTLGT
jgi:hypothetical protein